mgnify:CR=1 FL=1
MSKFATFEEGFPTGFYDPTIHGENIPSDAVEISDEQWQEFLVNPGRRKWQDGSVVEYTPPPLPITSEDINRERQRRVVAGKTINGIAVTGRDEDARNLTNLALAAQLRLASADTTTLTTFRDGNNVDHDLTPSQMLDLWQQSAAYVSALYEASWVIKAMDPIPADFDADSRWPV